MVDFEEKFEKEMTWLRENVEEDEIYEFAFRSFLAAEYFLWKWSQWVDLHEEKDKDKIAEVLMKNIMSVRFLIEWGVKSDHRDSGDS